MKKAAVMVNVVVGVLVVLAAAPTTQALTTEAQSSQLFILPLTHHNFSFESAGVSYVPSLLNMPDLPSWLHYSYSPAVFTGFVYGVPPEGLQDFQVHCFNCVLMFYMQIKLWYPSLSEC
ncbi:hypothetical protein E2C01_099599 [Portunus trituberculatus]|uniref:Sarcoglycan alpha/epsilon N-terminal domain-containing protein n=1 Tax=Portunus trituberculatus TaxID=210409 RepID=A0A5B7KA28_PORTR|nr:hypothetical protein [Portunus trituberculatus]